MSFKFEPAVVYNAELSPDVRDYGIQVPTLADRKHSVFKSLMEDEVLARNASRWHVDKVPEPVTREDLLRVHQKEFVDDLFSARAKERVEVAWELFDENGRPNRYNPQDAKKPLSDFAKVAFRQCGATVLASELALERGFAFFLGGGMHHARFETGAGFCLVNDVVIAARRLQALGRAKNIWVIDVDAHKGDGTAALTQGDTSIATLSIHMARGWPLNADRYLKDGSLNPSFLPSTVDIDVEKTEQRNYNQMLRAGLLKLEAAMPKPDIAFVVNGSDPFEGDVLPSAGDLKLTLSELMERDTLVFEFLKERSIPQCYVLGGGYGPEVWRVHAQILRYVLRGAYL